MIRLVGILTGSAIAVGLLIVTLGIPEFATEPAVPARPIEPVAELPATPPAGMPEEPQVEPAADASQPDGELMSDEMPEPTAAPSEAPPVDATEPGSPYAELSPASEAGWFAFWSPFRSELAATGFIAELQRTTGLDYRVVKLKPGVYEVAFAYSNDSDMQDKLTRIATATGLDLSGG